MELDIKKVMTLPKDKCESIEMMNEAQQNVLEALHIMDSFIENQDLMEFHEERMKKFIKKFEN